MNLSTLSLNAAIQAAITDARRRAGLTQRQLARLLGRPPSWIAKIETGERRVMLLDAFDLSAGLGVTAAELQALIDHHIRMQGLRATLAFMRRTEPVD
jgi:transcriptional regulator with XRE-family HTH domain